VIKALALLAATAASVAQDSGAAVQFVACPIYRDTDAGRKSGCWLADDPATGIRYDITASPTKPDWNHAVLVEGKVSAATQDYCGGKVIEPARLSVLEASCTRHMIPGEAFPSRKFALPERNVRPLYEDRKRPEAPYAEGRFTIPFDFRSSFVVYQLSDYYLDQTINYALDVQPARVEVSARAQTRPMAVSGQQLAEEKSLARERADLVRRALMLRGVPEDRIRIVEGPDQPFVPAAFDGLVGPAERRADIRIIPER
jgi:hypothetical protein